MTHFTRWQRLALVTVILLVVWLGGTAVAQGRENNRLLEATRRDAATIRDLRTDLASLRSELGELRSVADQLEQQVVALGGTPIVHLNVEDRDPATPPPPPLPPSPRGDPESPTATTTSTTSASTTTSPSTTTTACTASITGRCLVP